MIEALGGPRMAAAGASIRYPMEGLTAFGLVEVVTKLARPSPAAARARARDFRAGRYDLVILIDYPGFHLRVAEAARRAGTKVLYYIAPQLWAWRPGRARRFAAAVDRLAVVLPFEQRFFGELGLRSEYVGPSAGRPRRRGPRRAEARASLGIPAESRVLGIFPGSRHAGGRRGSGSPFRDAARQLLGEGRCDRVVVAGTAGGDYPDPGPLDDRCAATRSRCSPPPTRRWPSPAPRRSRPRWRTCRWWWRTRCIR